MEHRTNCKNCGAPLLPDGSCQYCGTYHHQEEKSDLKMYSLIDQSSTGITITVFNDFCEAYRDETGILRRRRIRTVIGG